MKIKVLTLRLNSASGTFNDKELADFQLGKDILEVSEHFLIHDKIPTLVLDPNTQEFIGEGFQPYASNIAEAMLHYKKENPQSINNEERVWESET